MLHIYIYKYIYICTYLLLEPYTTDFICCSSDMLFWIVVIVRWAHLDNCWRCIKIRMGTKWLLLLHSAPDALPNFSFCLPAAAFAHTHTHTTGTLGQTSTLQSPNAPEPKYYFEEMFQIHNMLSLTYWHLYIYIYIYNYIYWNNRRVKSV